MNQITESAIFRTVQQWTARNFSILPPASKINIEQAFADHDGIVPQDIAELYRLTAGMSDHSTDNYMWSLWSLDRVIAHRNECGSTSQYVSFADFMISSHLYSVKPVNALTSEVYMEYNGKYNIVAESLEKFFEMYLGNPKEISID